MKIRTQDYDKVTVVELQGEFDIEFSGLFENTVKDIVSKGVEGIVIDMTDVGFIDSVGLEQLLWARDYCSENNCHLKLAGLDEDCEQIFQVTRLENEFDRYAELAEAVKSCK